MRSGIELSQVLIIFLPTFTTSYKSISQRIKILDVTQYNRILYMYLVGCFGFNGSISSRLPQRERERELPKQAHPYLLQAKALPLSTLIGRSGTIKARPDHLQSTTEKR